MSLRETTFEESILRLEEILKQLEGDKVDLATALSQYEEGVRLLKNCHGILESARQKIEILRGVEPDGTPIVEPLETL
ncbi:MAG: exodeoxyribonuclease VII small subunit [Planctomycetaceae bacterium]|jgi:exodeoxyribonuclease VII small subunit|nr:exodeoxyribonuclease VII small subunit [Planctomycetaceae bacterium]